jgi:hypothetical protein
MTNEFEKDLVKLDALWKASNKLRGNERIAFKIHSGKVRGMIDALKEWDDTNIYGQSLMIEEANKLLEETENIINNLPLRDN